MMITRNLLTQSVRKSAVARSVHTGRRAFSYSASTEKTRNFDFIEADSGIKSFKLYHKTHIALIGLTPVAVAVSPSILNCPIDLALAVVLPLHGHIAMNWIISDYVPPSVRKGTRFALAGLTLATAAGLLKLNYDGPGITESVKGLWREAPAKDASSSGN